MLIISKSPAQAQLISQLLVKKTHLLFNATNVAKADNHSVIFEIRVRHIDEMKWSNKEESTVLSKKDRRCPQIHSTKFLQQVQGRKNIKAYNSASNKTVVDITQLHQQITTTFLLYS